MSSEKNIPSIRDIHSKFNLQDYAREWHNKRIKLSRQFWSLVLHTAHGKHPKLFRPQIFSRSYMYLFYRPLEIYQFIYSLFNGCSTNQLKKEIDFAAEKRFFKKINDSHAVQLRKLIENIGFKTQSSGVFQINTTEFDSRHPELDKVSECFEPIVDYGQIPHYDSIVFALPFDLSQSVCHQFYKTADLLIQSELFYSALDQIEFNIDSVNTYYSKTTVDGPTNALRHAILYNPDLLSLPDQRIKYEVSLRYTLSKGTFDHFLKVIKRERQYLD